MNSLVHQSSYPIYISYSSAISGFQSENIRDVGIDCLPKTDQKETVANFNLIRLPRHRLPTKTWMSLSAKNLPTHPLHRVFGVNFFDKMQSLEAFPISLVLQYAAIFLHAQYLLLKQKVTPS